MNITYKKIEKKNQENKAFLSIESITIISLVQNCCHSDCFIQCNWLKKLSNYMVRVLIYNFASKLEENTEVYDPMTFEEVIIVMTRMRYLLWFAAISHKSLPSCIRFLTCSEPLRYHGIKSRPNCHVQRSRPLLWEGFRICISM